MTIHTAIPTRSYGTRLSEHYAAVRSRLGAPSTGLAREAVLLDFRSDSHVVDDPVPNQRRATALTVEPISSAAEIVAARRTLAAFARLRAADPATNSMTHLLHATAIGFKVDVAVILDRSRRPNAVRIRQIAMYLANHVCGMSRQAISKRFDRNHTTVLYAQRKLEGLLDGATSGVPSASPEVST